MLKVKNCSQSYLADKSIVGSLMGELTTKRFDWSQPINDHVTHISNLAAKLGMDEEGRLKKMKDHGVNFLSHNGASISKAKPSKKSKKGKSFFKGPES
ncbi:hypothetical protein KSS87_003558, partial [Heliosperma pusillum]